MEALAAASSIIAVVGLTGQVLEGCNFIRQILSGAKDAPEDLQLLIVELTIIEKAALSIENYASALTEEFLDEDAKPALEFCHEAVGKLKGVLEKYGDQSDSNAVKRWGRRLSMAMSADKLAKHVARLQRAKGHLLDVQMHILMIGQQEHTSQLQEAIKSSQQLEVCQSTYMRIITRSEGTLEQLKQSSDNTNRLLHQMSSHVTAELPGLLSSTVTSAVERTLRGILHEEISRTTSFERQTRLPIQAPERTQLQITLPRRNTGTLQGGSPDYAEMIQNDFVEDVANPLPTMPKFRNQKSLRSLQDCNYRAYNTWLGTVQMRTTNLLYREEGCEDKGSDASSQPTKATETDILILPKLWLFSRGAFVRYTRQQDPWSNSVDFTFKMHHFRVVPDESPVIKACKNGRFMEIQHLFQDRLASPFDRTQSGLTLLDVAFATFLKLPNLKVGRHLLTPDLETEDADPSGLLDIIKCLLRCGLDPAEIKTSMAGLRSTMPPLGRLLESDRDASPSNEVREVQRTEHVTRLARLLIDNAQVDPFENVDLTRIHADFIRNEASPVTSAILMQESWYMDWDVIKSWEDQTEKSNIWEEERIEDHIDTNNDYPIFGKFPEAQPKQLRHRTPHKHTGRRVVMPKRYRERSLSEEIGQLLKAPTFFSPAGRTYKWKWPREDRMLVDRRKVRLLALTLAAGYNPAPVKDPANENDGKLLHQIMESVHTSWQSQLFHEANVADYDWAQRTRDYQVRALNEINYMVHRTLVKMVELLVACLKHDISPLSPNLTGVTPTAYAKRIGFLQFWMMALRKAGFDADRIVAEDKNNQW